MLKSLFRKKPTIPAKYADWGLESHLRGACSRNDVEKVRELLALGANPNTNGVSNDGPIHIAARYGSIELIGLLLNYGADPLQTELVYGEAYLLPSGCARHHGRHDLADYLKSIEEKRIAAIVAAGGKPPRFDTELKSEEDEDRDEWQCGLPACPHRRPPSSQRPPPPPMHS